MVTAEQHALPRLLYAACPPVTGPKAMAARVSGLRSPRQAASRIVWADLDAPSDQTADDSFTSVQSTWQ